MEDILTKLGLQYLRSLVSNLIDKKCKDQGVVLAKGDLDHIVDRLMYFEEKDENSFEIDGANISITFNEDEFKDIERDHDFFMENQFPDLVEKTINSAADSLFVDLKNKWPAERNLQGNERSGFRARLRKRWGIAFDYIDMMLTVGREIGQELSTNTSSLLMPHHTVRNKVLLRLHARSCQIVAEILVLLENGLADGAMARWRTLHEVSVVATLLREHGSELAQRYLDHDVVEAYKSLQNYLKTYEQLGFDPIPENEAAEVKEHYDAMLLLHGDAFARDYGWAAKHLKRSNTFADLAEAARRAHISTHYRMASQNVHAGIKGITNQLSVLRESPVILAGHSDAGLEEPGQCTALTFSLINSLIVFPDEKENYSFMKAMQLKVLNQLQSGAISAFIDAGKSLHRDFEKSHNRGSRKKWRRPETSRSTRKSAPSDHFTSPSPSPPA